MRHQTEQPYYQIKLTEDPKIMNQSNTVCLLLHDETSRFLNSIVSGMLIALLSVLMLSVSTHAQTPAPNQDRPIALEGATIHTISDGVIENGTIVFEDGIITEIGEQVQIPDGAERVDASGKEIYPGLIDGYSQMGIYEIGAVNMTVDINELDRFNPNVTPEIAFNPESRHIGTARTAGVLTAVTTPSGGLVSGQTAAMMLDGWSWEDMVLKSGVGLFVNWPSPGDEDDYAENLLELRDAFAGARSYHKAKRAMEAGEASRKDVDSRLEAMIPVLEGDRPVIVEAHDLRQIQDAITWAEEEDVRLIIMGGRDAHYVANHLVRKEIPVIVTTVLTSPNRQWEPYDGRYSLPARLHEAGVAFAIAGGASAPYTYRLPNEAGAAAAYGLDRDEALRSVTLSVAEILGIDDRVGSLQVGKDATLLITTGNPLEYSSQIEQAYIEGRKIDMVDAHRMLYEKYRQKVDQRVGR